MYTIAFVIFICVIVLIPVFLCVIPCVDAFRNWEFKPSSHVHEDALEEMDDGNLQASIQNRSDGSIPYGANGDGKT